MKLDFTYSGNKPYALRLFDALLDQIPPGKTFQINIVVATHSDSVEQQHFLAGLESILEKNRMAQGDLAQKLTSAGFPVTQSTVSKWVRKKQSPSPEMIHTIAQILDVPVTALYN